jgi:hypothetical protein
MLYTFAVEMSFVIVQAITFKEVLHQNSISFSGFPISDKCPVHFHITVFIVSKILEFYESHHFLDHVISYILQ